MTIDLHPRHTKVVETLATPFGTVVREDWRNYPNHESNLYLVGPGNAILWLAQRAFPDDVYPNPIAQIGSDKIRCYSFKGVECDIDLRTGKLVNAELVR